MGEDDLQWEREQEDERRQNETFRRVHQLAVRGYTPTLDGEVEDAIWWYHPGTGPTIILYSGGMVVSPNNQINPNAKRDRDRIYNVEPHDAKLFDQFIRSVQIPSWRQRTAKDRTKYVWMPGCLIIFVLISIGISKIFGALWKHFQ